MNQNIWDLIDLKRHAIIEASAGTGKTYTILQFVLRLILEESVDLERILLVTFTEKATGELKDRIREGLENALQNPKYIQDPQVKSRLELNLARVDQAPIQTIHGFCLSTLQSQSFDAQMPLKTEIVSDTEGFAQMWRSLLRKDWGKILHTQMPDLKTEDALDLAQKTIENTTDLEGTLFKFCRAWSSPFLQVGENLQEVYLKTLEEEKAQKILLEEQEQLLVNLKYSAAKIWPLVWNLEKPKEAIELKNLLINIIKKDQASDILGRFAENKIAKLFDASFAKKLNLNEIAPQMAEQWSALHRNKKSIQNVAWNDVAQLAISCLAQEVVQKWQLHKEEFGLMSFDDMIQKLALLFQDPTHPLLEKVRQMYEFGIVDEFQDTDEAQWTIFRSIFLWAPPLAKASRKGSLLSHHLLVVGDPKQAIYSFRGADLNTYFYATQEMQSQFLAQRFELKLNYRSTPQMISAYNQLFLTVPMQEWFRHENIVYDENSQVNHGVRAGSIAPHGHEDDLDNPLQILDLSDIKSAPLKYKFYAQWIVQKILKYCNPASPLMIPDEEHKGQTRPLQFSDIAILSRSKKHFQLVSQALDQAQIPWDQYKQTGIFSSEECFHFIVLLEAILSAGQEQDLLRKVSLTPFFHLSLEELEFGEKEQLQMSLDKVRQKLQNWAQLAEKRELSKLLRHINQESDYFAYFQNDQHGDRILSNLLQIQNTWLEWLLTEHLSLQDSILKLRHYRNNPDTLSEEESLFQLAHERPKVQLLTMHTSKGLEYPVVFHCLSTKDTSRAGPWSFKTQPQDTHKKLFCFKSSPLNQEQFVEDVVKQQNEEDYARLLYVALTRASCLQFLPLLSSKELHNEHLLNFIELNPKAKFSPNFEEVLAPQIYSLESSILLNNSGLLKSRLQKIGQLSPPKTQYSFTKISPHEHMRQASPIESHGKEYDEILAIEEEILEQSPQTPSSLPPGKHTGIFWHSLFEEADWSILSQTEIDSHILAEIPSKNSPDNAMPEVQQFRALLNAHQSKNGLWHSSDAVNLSRRLETIQVLKQTLYAAIPDPFYLEPSELGLSHKNPILPSQTFVLGEISGQNRKAELDFLCPIDAQGRAFPEQKSSQVYSWLTGSLDLVFKHENRYYILDWKSNYLKNYGPEALHLAIQEKHYDLQAAIYSLALDRWLSSVVPDYKRETHFGGIIYAFVRGPGFWIRRPSPQDWQTQFKDSLGADLHLDELILKDLKNNDEGIL